MTSEEDCTSKTAKWRYYTTNIVTSFHFGYAILFIYICITKYDSPTKQVFNNYQWSYKTSWL